MQFIVFSHLRWDFVYQRPQHLLSRCAKTNQVLFWEEAKYTDTPEPGITVTHVNDSLTVVCPELNQGHSEDDNAVVQSRLLESYLAQQKLEEFVLWYYTPMALAFSRQLRPLATVYDCMDELSGFRGAPPTLQGAEADLFARADLVFTGGRSLFEAKCDQHPSVHCFPSSIDVNHFERSRTVSRDPADQAGIPRPRIGYCGVIDERMDLELLGQLARQRPEWHLVMIGPVVKISESDLPHYENIHYLGSKKYDELPAYMAGWDVAILPFARNESTRFISPTKTPEYLAAGLPCVSTAIRDVIRPYGERGLVEIADQPEEFIEAVQRCLSPESPMETSARLARTDAFLSQSSWDRTWNEMEQMIHEVITRKQQFNRASKEKGLELTTAE